jgi:hypothetical protein
MQQTRRQPSQWRIGTQGATVQRVRLPEYQCPSTDTTNAPRYIPNDSHFSRVFSEKLPIDTINDSKRLAVAQAFAQPRHYQQLHQRGAYQTTSRLKDQPP